MQHKIDIMATEYASDKTGGNRTYSTALDGTVTESGRFFESILCSKGDLLWDDPKAKNFDKKRCV